MSDAGLRATSWAVIVQLRDAIIGYLPDAWRWVYTVGQHWPYLIPRPIVVRWHLALIGVVAHA